MKLQNASAPLVSHYRMVALALPMTLAHVTVPLLGITDAAAVGRLGEAHLLGAVALGAVIFDFLFWSFGALRMGTAGLTAQALGAGDRQEIEKVLARACIIAILVGLFLLSVQFPVKQAAFAVSDASPAVLAALDDYYTTRIWAAPLTLLNYALLGSLIGRARTDLGLIVQVLINAINIALTLTFVLVLDMGIKGAALGTALAELAGVFIGFATLHLIGARPFRKLPGVFNRQAFLKTLSVNSDIMIRTMALLAAFLLFTRLGGQQGDVTLAANAILYNMFLIGGFFLDGFATAAETLCGQAYGARRKDVFRRAANLALFWCLIFGAALSFIFLITGQIFITFISTNPDVQKTAETFLAFAALTPLIGAAAFAYDGIYTGAAWSAAMRNLMLIAFAVFALVALLGQSYGNIALWTAFLIFLAARGLGQALLYPRLLNNNFPLNA